MIRAKRTTLKLSSGMRVVKFLLFFFNFMFLIFGIKLIVVGSILNVQFKDYLDFQGASSIGAAAILIILFGVVITVIAFFGCNGSIRESRCMTLTFSALLIMTFFVELAIVLVGFSLKDQVFTLLQDEMTKSIHSTEPGIIKTWNLLQREFECCGFNGPEDYKKKGPFIPNSCCKSDILCPSDENPMFPEGCYKSLITWTSSSLSVMASIALGLAIFQIFGTTFSCLLARSIKKGYEIVDD